MKYQARKECDLFIGALVLLYLVLMFVLVHPEQNLDSTKAWMMALCIAGFFGVVFFLFYQDRVLSSNAYAMIEDDGIHIISKKKGELAFRPWTDARDCRRIPYRRGIDCMMLLFRYDEAFCGKPLATYQGSPSPDEKDVRPYLLDELMVRLDRGEMTAQEFCEMPFFLVLTGARSTDNRWSKYHSMWRAAKDRAAEQEGTR